MVFGRVVACCNEREASWSPTDPPTQPDPSKINKPPQDPWFLAELPPNALSMNDHYLQLAPLTKQTPDEISAVVKAVRAGG